MTSRREVKQAVVLIHGIGEQKPMSTLRSFVKAVLRQRKDGKYSFWSKPDPVSDLFELRRLQSRDPPVTHFYEFYWAYHIGGTKWSHLFVWLRSMLFRLPSNVPESVRELWMISWGAILAFVVSSINAGFALSREGLSWTSYWLITSLGIAATALGVQRVLLGYLGDAARYLSATPENVALRQKIRSDGVTLLRQLHASKDYDRIIIVGHSLGSVIGYDILTWFWLEQNKRYDFAAKGKELDELLKHGKSPQPFIRHRLAEAGAKLGKSPVDLEVFREAQVEGWKEQRFWGNPWRITDFVTIGSPLRHARILMAEGSDDFDDRVRQRELPTCPPVREGKGYVYNNKEAIRLESGRIFSPLFLHHAAPFAVTRWTNLYFPTKFGFFGDFISGPLQKEFGPGIKDVPVRWDSLLSKTPAAHTKYWDVRTAGWKSKPAAPRASRAVIAVREALHLNHLRRL